MKHAKEDIPPETQSAIKEICSGLISRSMKSLGSLQKRTFWTAPSIVGYHSVRISQENEERAMR